MKRNSHYGYSALKTYTFFGARLSSRGIITGFVECLGLIFTPFFTLQAWFGDLKLNLGARFLPSKWSSFKNASLKMYITYAMPAKKINQVQFIFFHHCYLFYVRKAVNWLKMFTHTQKVP